MAETGSRSTKVARDPRRNFVIGIAVVAAIVVGVLILLRPLDDGPATPVEVATVFVEAYEVLDVDTASSYLAADANLHLFNANTEELPLAFSWDEATGFKILLDSCAETSSGPSGTTVRCDYEYHGIRSEEIGLGPYGGSWLDFTVLDGKIASGSDHLEFTLNGFSSEMWVPFAAWVAETHPDDVTIMYGDSSQTSPQITDESIALWEQRTREYVEVVGG